jgi:hypothetical protein
MIVSRSRLTDTIEDAGRKGERGSTRWAPQRGYYRFRSPSYTRLSSPTAEQPLVYYLFGHHEDRESLVLTEADLIEFLVAIVGAKPPVPDQVRSILADPDASYLFLGR